MALALLTVRTPRLADAAVSISYSGRSLPRGLTIAALVAMLPCIVQCGHDLRFLSTDGGSLDVPAATCIDRTTGHSRCPAGSTCASSFARGELTVGCIATCDPANPTPCTGGLVCQTTFGGPSRGLCVAPCRGDSDCRPGFLCDSTAGRCVCGTSAACSVAAGFPSVCVSGRCAPECTADADCQCGTRCLAGACVGGCQSDADCCGAGTCAAGRCTLDPSPDVGSRCAASDDCPANMYCDRTFARGQCVPIPTNPQCAAGACPTGTRCVRTASGARCRIDCDPAAEGSCPVGSLCNPDPIDPTRGRCEPQCRSNANCPAGLTCDVASGRCQCAGPEACRALTGPNATCDMASASCRCTRTCEGRMCGDDGCGGSCGTCAVGTACTPENTCGPPRCGEGNFVVPCPGGAFCPNNSTCTDATSCTCATGYVARRCGGSACNGDCSYPDWWCEQCTPNCAGRSCGSDGCGGMCGSCPTGMSCNASGQCSASAGTCGSASSCGTCTPMATCGWCGATGRCLTGTASGPSGTSCASGWAWQPSECGGTTCSCAGRVCGPNSCGTGSCGTCPVGPDGVPPCTASGQCGGTSCSCSGRSCGPNSCGTGSCGTCASGQTCSGGVCTGGTTCTCAGRSCGPNSCGAGSCGTCASGQTCSGGVCTGGTTCSCTGRSCGPNSCGAGSCGTCASGNTCNSSGQCVPSAGSCTNLTGCVSMSSSRPTAAGSCTGEIVGYLMSSCSQRATCRFCVQDGGRYSGCGESSVSPGARVGGELGGIWHCGTSTSARYVYRCSLPTDPASCRAF